MTLKQTNDCCIAPPKEIRDVTSHRSSEAPMVPNTWALQFERRNQRRRGDLPLGKFFKGVCPRGRMVPWNLVVISTRVVCCCPPLWQITSPFPTMYLFCEARHHNGARVRKPGSTISVLGSIGGDQKIPHWVILLRCTSIPSISLVKGSSRSW